MIEAADAQRRALHAQDGRNSHQVVIVNPDQIVVRDRSQSRFGKGPIRHFVVSPRSVANLGNRGKAVHGRSQDGVCQSRIEAITHRIG